MFITHPTNVDLKAAEVSLVLSGWIKTYSREGISKCGCPVTSWTQMPWGQNGQESFSTNCLHLKWETAFRQWCSGERACTARARNLAETKCEVFQVWPLSLALPLLLLSSFSGFPFIGTMRTRWPRPVCRRRRAPGRKSTFMSLWVAHVTCLVVSC